MRWEIYFKLGGYNATNKNYDIDLVTAVEVGSLWSTNKNYDIYLVTAVEVGSLWSHICRETEDDLELLIFLHFPPRSTGWGYYKRCATRSSFVFIYMGLF